MSQPNTSILSLSKGRGTLEIRRILVDRFSVFRPKGTAKLPLKIGIYKDIRRAAPDLSIREVNKALANYTRGPTHLGA
jgi:sRNA-binding protein